MKKIEIYISSKNISIINKFVFLIKYLYIYIKTYSYIFILQINKCTYYINE